jgi:CopG family transcriptional regulator/antitoxin EndoAI
VYTGIAMSKRINIVLPEKTLAVLDRVAPKGSRSQFISRAVLYFVESRGREVLRERLKQEALANAARDVEMAAEWFALEQEAALDTAGSVKKRSTRRKTKAA